MTAVKARRDSVLWEGAVPTLALPDLELRYLEAGRGPALVLLHGLGGSGADWAPLVEAFRGRFRVLAPDSRGCGETRALAAPHGPFTLPQLAGDVEALLEGLGTGPAHVVGWSLGGMVALQLAVQAPARVASLAVVNSGPDWRAKTPLQHLALKARGLATALLGPGTVAPPLARRLFPRPDQAALRRAYVARLAAADRRAYAALLDAFLGWSVEDRLPELAMPALVVASDGDYTSVASKEAWARGLPRGRLQVVEDSRHALPLEAPERLGAVLSEFLASL